MKKILLSIFMLSTLFAAAQSSITVSFKAESTDGTPQALDSVRITDESQGWTQTLAYPDFNLTLIYEDGIGESSSQRELSQNFPNPFSGYTETILDLEKDEQTCIQIVGMDGKILAERNECLPQGKHCIGLHLAKPQLALLHVVTPQHSYTIKMLNIGEGSSNNIEVYDLPEKISKNTKSSDEWAFAPGDMMSYTGIAILDSINVVTSNTVTQPLYHDDTITLVFDIEIPEEPQLPTVTTSEISDITYTTAVCGGEVINDGGTEVTARGVCWATTENPTTSDSLTTNGSGIGDFVSILSNLTAGTTYYVRAYAINSVGTAYGDMKSFTSVSISLPEVTTTDVSDITSTAAACGGEITSDGGAEVTERGVCWSSNPNPTINDTHITSGNGTGSFTSILTNLTATSTYYVRAYAINYAGTAYGDEVSFTTNEQPQMPQGALNGIFSVSATKQVFFSQGNLQYNAAQGSHSTIDGGTAQGTWRFADNQWYYIGEENSNISETYDGWIDLFGWATSGWDNGGVCYQPWSFYMSDDCYYPDCDENNGLTGNGAYADWGVYNAISNGGNMPGLWRTMTRDEWDYLLNSRPTNSGMSYTMAQVNNVNGIILLPDEWDSSIYNLNSTNKAETDFSINVIDTDTWTNIMEPNGAVFLPTARCRKGTETFYNEIYGSEIYGYYWSASCSVEHGFEAWEIMLCSFVSSIDMAPELRYYGQSVRLVTNAN